MKYLKIGMTVMGSGKDLDKLDNLFPTKLGTGFKDSGGVFFEYSYENDAEAQRDFKKVKSVGLNAWLSDKSLIETHTSIHFTKQK